MYYKGEGIEKDYKKARYWFERLAEQGRVEAQHNFSSDVLQRRGRRERLCKGDVLV